MKELLKKSEAELVKTLTEKREALRAFRFGVSGSKIKNMKEGRTVRKDIARVMTALRSITK
jgi:ribosomal protein L29